MTPYNNNPESSRDLTVYIMSSISSFDIINVAFAIPASAANAAAVNPNGI